MNWFTSRCANGFLSESAFQCLSYNPSSANENIGLIQFTFTFAGCNLNWSIFLAYSNLNQLLNGFFFLSQSAFQYLSYNPSSVNEFFSAEFILEIMPLNI